MLAYWGCWGSHPAGLQHVVVVVTCTPVGGRWGSRPAGRRGPGSRSEVWSVRYRGWVCRCGVWNKKVNQGPVYVLDVHHAASRSGARELLLSKISIARRDASGV